MLVLVIEYVFVKGVEIFPKRYCVSLFYDEIQNISVENKREKDNLCRLSHPARIIVRNFNVLVLLK